MGDQCDLYSLFIFCTLGKKLDVSSIFTCISGQKYGQDLKHMLYWLAETLPPVLTFRVIQALVIACAAHSIFN